MNKYYKAIVKLNNEFDDVKAFVKVNNLEIDKPLSVILTKRLRGFRIGREINIKFKWPNKLIDSLLLTHTGTWNEFEIVLMGKELSPTEVEDIKRLATALS